MKTSHNPASFSAPAVTLPHGPSASRPREWHNAQPTSAPRLGTAALSAGPHWGRLPRWRLCCQATGPGLFLPIWEMRPRDKKDSSSEAETGGGDKQWKACPDSPRTSKWPGSAAGSGDSQGPALGRPRGIRGSGHLPPALLLPFSPSSSPCCWGFLC